MLTKQRIYPKILLAMATLLSMVLLATTIKVGAVENTANTLKVTPVRTDITADPGETKVVEITVTNPSTEVVVVRAIQNDFVAGDEDGTPALILDENEYAPKRSLKRFMTPIENVTVPAGESVAVPVTITVPATASAGGYFGALRFAPTAPNSGGQVNLSASVASLILLRVNGDASEKLTMSEFVIQQAGKGGSWFMNTNDITAHVRFKNDGDVQLGPIGKISVKKGDKVVYEADFNNKDRRDMILPESARRWTIPVDKVSEMGQYTVSATFTYGSKNETMTIERSFWIIPVGVAIGAAVLGLLIIAVIIWLIIRARGSGSKKGGVALGSRR